MRILITALPYISHLPGLVPLGQALLAAGHLVTAALPGFAHRWLAPYGFDLIEIGYRGTPPTGRPAPAEPEDFAGTLAWHNTLEYLRVAERVRPDLVLHEDTEFGGYLAAELLGIPHVCVGACGGANTLEPDFLFPRLDEHRRRLGLPPDPAGEAQFRYRFIDWLPPTYAFTQRPMPNTRAYRLAMPEHPGRKVPGWVADLPVDRPLVLAAVGTNAQPGAARLAAVTVEALADVECTAVLATDVDLTTPAHIRPVTHLPQTLLVPTCDLFVHHGGLNSVREAMMCGVPVVVTPFGADQPHNAQRSAAYGFGLVVDPATVTAEALREACRTVLGDPDYARRARAAQRAFLPLPDASAAVADLVDLVTRRADSAPRKGRGTYASADQ